MLISLITTTQEPFQSQIVFICLFTTTTIINSVTAHLCLVATSYVVFPAGCFCQLLSVGLAMVAVFIHIQTCDYDLQAEVCLILLRVDKVVGDQALRSKKNSP